MYFLKRKQRTTLHCHGICASLATFSFTIDEHLNIQVDIVVNSIVYFIHILCVCVWLGINLALVYFLHASIRINDFRLAKTKTKRRERNWEEKIQKAISNWIKLKNRATKMNEQATAHTHGSQCCFTTDQPTEMNINARRFRAAECALCQWA